MFIADEAPEYTIQNHWVAYINATHNESTSFSSIETNTNLIWFIMACQLVLWGKLSLNHRRQKQLHNWRVLMHLLKSIHAKKLQWLAKLFVRKDSFV